MPQVLQITAYLGIKPLQENRFLYLLRQGNSAHRIFWAIVGVDFAAYMLLRLLRPDLAPTNVLLGPLTVFGLSLPIMLLCLFMLRFYHVARYVKPEKPGLALLKDMKEFLTHPQRMANGLPMLAIMVIFGFIFSDIQAKILTLNPSTWDSTFANLDKTLHFGYQPWQWLQPVLGYAPITFLLNVNYNIWFFVMWMFFIFFGFAYEPSVLRTRFFLSYIATWIIGGGVLATIFASAGPCYYSRLGLSPDPYTGLMSYLRSVNDVLPVWAIQIQDALWLGHVNQVELSEVSAMPSMHNASALLFAFVGYQINRFWGRVLALHAALIFIGSVHLAWHYAIDGYASWLLVVVIWFAMAPVARWWHTAEVQKDFDAALKSGI